jgi:hypothetical protein
MQIYASYAYRTGDYYICMTNVRSINSRLCIWQLSFVLDYARSRARDYFRNLIEDGLLAQRFTTILASVSFLIDRWRLI